MKILETKIMRGPNFWSNYRKKLIVVKLDIGELENTPTDKITDYTERLKQLLPSLYSHRCSENKEGGFFERVELGTWAGHVMEHIALEIQSLAGMDCGYGRTRSTKDVGIYHVVFAYEIEKAGVYAATAAFNITNALFKGEHYDLTHDIEELKYIKLKLSFGPSIASIVEAAKKRNIPFTRLNNSSLITFGYGNKQKKIRATITGNTSGIGIEIACDKYETKSILSKAYVPVPKGILVNDTEELNTGLKNVQFPIVIKPIDGNHGRGITTNITTLEQALSAFEIAKTISKHVIVEEFIQGFDYRFLVINYKLVAVAKRTPALIMGDGRLSIQQLIDQTNSEPKRGVGHEKVMTQIKVDEVTKNILIKRHLNLSSVLPLGEILFLKDTANISTGGTSRDVTDCVHPYNIFLAERIARILNLDICGIDIVAKDINVPLTKEIGGIVEVNACPGLRMHLSPSKGLARNVAEPIIDMLFRENETGRIPIIAITGTNGKTTTTRLLAHIANQTGKKVGYTTTEGIYIKNQLIHLGDCTGPSSAETVLLDPTIDFAVLECARGGILRSGLGFDACDISIVTNVTEDHLGLKDIHTLEDLAKVKSVVAKSTKNEGYSILNADDDLVYAMRYQVDCQVALFSISNANERVLKHCENGGIAAIIENGYLVICKGRWKTRVEIVNNIPLTLGGRADAMIKNVLPATLAAYLQGFSMKDICLALQSFIPSPEQTPGRMNIFSFNNFDVMIDYAHNADGFLQLKKFMEKTEASVKIGIISATGDRRDEDIRKFGQLFAQMFDEIIIKHDKDLRGRSKENITTLLLEGIYSEKKLPIRVISNERDSVQYALDTAPKGSFITVCADNILDVIDYIRHIQSKEKESQIELIPVLDLKLQNRT